MLVDCEWITDGDRAVDLSRVQIFGPERPAVERLRAGQDYGIPERKPVTGLQANRVQYIVHPRAVYLPNGEIGNELRSSLRR